MLGEVYFCGNTNFNVIAMKIFKLFIVLFISFSAYSQDCQINVYEALKYKGQKTTVCGIVTQIYTPNDIEGNPVYINMGGKFPNHKFTIVIWGDDILKFKNGLEEYKDRHIAVTGKIKEYDGKAQIVLKDPKQIRINK